MNIGNIVEPNNKGQIVIPKQVREALGISPQTLLNLVVRGKGIYLYPVEEVVTKMEGESAYLKLLEQTQGSWANDDFEKQEKKTREIELEASRKNKQLW